MYETMDLTVIKPQFRLKCQIITINLNIKRRQFYTNEISQVSVIKWKLLQTNYYCVHC